MSNGNREVPQAMGFDIYECAREMLGLNAMSVLPTKLCGRLMKIDDLCVEVGGRLRSRQIVAMVVEEYLRNKE